MHIWVNTKYPGHTVTLEFSDTFKTEKETNNILNNSYKGVNLCHLFNGELNFI